MLRINCRWTYLDFASAFSQFLYWIYMCYLYFFRVVKQMFYFLVMLIALLRFKERAIGHRNQILQLLSGRISWLWAWWMPIPGVAPHPITLQTCWLKRAGNSLRIHKLSRRFFYNQSRDTLKNTLIRLTLIEKISLLKVTKCSLCWIWINVGKPSATLVCLQTTESIFNGSE